MSLALRRLFVVFGTVKPVELRRALVGCVYDVYAARALARNDQEAARLALLAVAGATSVPSEVVQLVADVGHGGALDHPRVGRGSRVHVNRSQVVRLLNPRPDVERHGVEHLLALGLHRLLG